MESAKLPIFALSCAARTCHAWLVRLTRARGRRYIRGRKALLYDFWYFSSLKSTIKEKFLYDFSRANNVRPLSRRRQHTCFAYVLIPLPCELKVLSTAKRQDTCFIPLSRRRRHTCFAYVSIPAFSFDEEGAKEKAIKKKTP